MKELYKFELYRLILKSKIVLIIFILCLTIMSFLLEISFPVLIGKGIDRVIYEKSLKGFLKIIGLIFLIIFLSLSFRFFYNFLLIYIRKDIEKRIHLAVFNKFLHFSLPYYEKFKTGELLRRLSGDIKEFMNLLSSTTFDIIGYGILFIAGISIILFYSPWFFLCIFVFLSFIFLINFLFSQRIRKEWNRYFEFFSIKEGVISENILGFIFIKLNNLYNIVKSIFEKTLHRLVDKEFKTNLMINLFSNILLLISFTGIIVIYGVLGILFAKGRISIGEGITVSVILFMLINSFSNISNNYISLQSSISAGLRIKELLEGPQEIVEDRINIQNLSIKKIVFKNVKFRYPGNENFILELDKEFLCGRTYALVGKSGSGKTSLMKLMCGLYSPQEGKILVNTYDLKALSLSQWRDKIGFMHQDPFILKDSVLNNIKLSKWDAGEKEIMKAAIEANLEEYIKSLPEGINTILGERGITISGGEKQRIELARIFLKNPEIVILDEPTAHLDVITEQSIKKALSQWKNDKTIFIITHKFFFIEFVDEVILLENGKVVDIGSHSSLLERNSLYREMLFLSTGGSDTIKKT